jgi:Protein of unknown function (DUF2637)
MTRADRVIRYSTVAAVAIVGLAAAVLSYRHQFGLAAGHGESALTAKLLPISIDGLLLAGTLAVLDASRRQTGHSWAARITVGLGVAMTMWANIVHGLGFGWTGIVISGWPPIALMAAIEVLARMIRPSPAPGPAALHPAALANGHAAPEGGKEAAERFAAELAAGELPSVRAIRREMHLGQPRAQEVRSYLEVLART